MRSSSTCSYPVKGIVGRGEAGTMSTLDILFRYLFVGMSYILYTRST